MLEAQFLEATYGHHYVLIDDIVNGSIHVSLGGNVLNADAVERSPVAYDGYLTTVEAIALAFPHVSTHNLQRLFNTTSRFHDTPIIFHKFPPVVTDEMLAIFNQLDRPQQSYLTPAILKKALPDFTEEEIEHHIADACKASSRGRGIVPKSSVLCFTAFCELVKHAYRPFFGLLDFQR
ncbi:hypothetical protein DIPPA_18297 [Diplonema papillatum]|nr:hypothetical protein DIPPA_18297 [Diplonema papillatum]